MTQGTSTLDVKAFESEIGVKTILKRKQEQNKPNSDY